VTSTISGEQQTEQVERPSIVISGEPQAIRVITSAIEQGDTLPELYVSGGELVHLSKVSGDCAPIGGEKPPQPMASARLDVAGLGRLLANHANVCRVKRDKEGAEKVEEVSPGPRVLSAVLSARYWPGVRELYGIVGSPVLRPDGTLLQTAGYDQATGLYFAPKVKLEQIPMEPTPAQVTEAREFILDKLLRDFPFVGPADKANHVGLLVSEILRPYLRSLTPFGLISATTQSSGKTLLAEIPGYLFGQKNLVWRKGDDAELEKSITASLRSPAPVMLWDNLAEGSTVSAAVLAQLLTTPVWSGRVLGSTSTVEIPNNRLWLATGNNIRLGGDMATRTVLVRLDPKEPHPDQRDQNTFGIPNLDTWLKETGHRAEVLRHLLILVMDWMAAGAPRSSHTMRQFTTWAKATGGFLAHHGIDGFLDNVEDVREADEENAEWVTFLAKWHELNGEQKRPVRHVRQTADIEMIHFKPVDHWQGTFLTDDNGKIPSAKSLGKWLTGHVGRWHGSYVLHSEMNKITNARVYWVEKKPT
jgi:hypothetical protein